MYNQVRLAQQNVTAPPTTTQPPVTPAQTVAAPMPMAPAPAAPTPWLWIAGGVLAVGAVALVLGVLKPARR